MRKLIAVLVLAGSIFSSAVVQSQNSSIPSKKPGYETRRAWFGKNNQPPFTGVPPLAWRPQEAGYGFDPDDPNAWRPAGFPFDQYAFLKFPANDFQTVASRRAAAGETEAWVRHYGSTGLPGRDVAWDVKVDDLGNVYVTGLTAISPFGFDYYTIKYDASGATLWSKAYDGPGKGDDFAFLLALDRFSNVYVAGSSWSGAAIEYTIVKYSANGDEQWVARYGGSTNYYSSPTDMFVDNEGNVYVTGSTSAMPSGVNYDYATVKFDANGQILWSARYDGPANSFDEARHLSVDAAGNVYVTGISRGNGSGSDFATIKYNSAGIQQWVARYNSHDQNDSGTGIVTDGGGNVYVTGSSRMDTVVSFVTIKYNSAGEQRWLARYGSDNFNLPAAIAIDGPDALYVSGWSQSRTGASSVATVKYNSDGIEQWAARHPGVGGNLALDNSGNVYASGNISDNDNDDDFLLIKYDANGVSQWVARSSYASEDISTALFVDRFGNAYLAGLSSTRQYPQDDDYATVRYDANGVEQWVARYNGEGSAFDETIGLFLEKSGRVKVIGKTGRQSAGYGVVTYSPNGDELAVANFAGPFYDIDDIVNPTAFDSLGNIYVTGTAFDSITRTNFYTVKFDPLGNKLWEAYYNGSGNSWDRPTGLAIDQLGNVYVTGSSEGVGENFDFVTVKYNQQGIEQWAQRFDGPGGYSDFPEAITLDRQGNVYVAGSSANDFANNPIQTDYTVIAYDPAGLLKWARHYNGTAGDVDVASAIQTDDEGNIYVTGRSEGVNSQYDYVTIKYSQAGEALWVARYNGPENSDDWPYALAVDGSGNVYVTGYKATVKYDSNGQQQWAVQDGGAFLAVDEAGSVYITAVRGAQSDIVTSKYDTEGIEQWAIAYTGPGFSFDSPTGLALSKEGDVYISGTTWGGSGWMVYTTIKYVQDGNGQITPADFALAQNFPNPVDLSTSLGTIIRFDLPSRGHVKLQVFNLLGQQVANLVDGVEEAGVHTMNWLPGDLPSGVYFYRLQVTDASRGAGQSFSEIKKLLVLK